MRFKTYEDSMNSKKLIEFLYRLYKNNKYKIIVILDNLAVHHSKHFKNWLKDKNYLQKSQHEKEESVTRCKPEVRPAGRTSQTKR